MCNLKMALDSDTCGICSGFLGSSPRKKVGELGELLEVLLVQTTFKLLEELLICDACMIKVQLACKFKTNYLENAKEICIKVEDIENEAVCEICKEIVNPVDCVPLFHSVTEIDKANLLTFLSSKLVLNSEDSPQTCESCHKSILNFCIIIKSFSVVKDRIFDKTVSNLKLIKSNSDQDVSVNSVGSTDDCTMDIKEGKTEIKEEQEPITSYEDFLCKNEEVDIKVEDEQIWSYGRQECLAYSNEKLQKFNLKQHVLNHTSKEIEMSGCEICDFQTKNKRALKSHLIAHENSYKIEIFKCHICNYLTKHKGHLNKHLIVHKTSNETEIFKCQNCDYQTKCKYQLKKHQIRHKNSNDFEMFSCQICDFQSKFKYSLKKHQITHKNFNEVEMFKCQICHYQTKYKYYLKGHMIIHKNSNETEMFKCHICDFQTKHKSCFRRHLSRFKHGVP